MREILFRGKRKFDNKWVIGGYCTRFNRQKRKNEVCICEPYTDDDYYVIPETIGQYTGLTDKNGKNIFEGDIVHYQYEPGEGFWNFNQNSVIKWESTGFYMQGIMGTNKYALSQGWLESIPHGDGQFFEVIGNVYDDSDLLNE